MPWLQIKIQTTEQYSEQISTFLNLLGAVSIGYEDAADQPMLEPAVGATPLWSQLWIVSLFDPAADAAKIINFLIQQLGSEAVLDQHIEQLSDQDWERSWLEHFQPMRFGKNLWICPSAFTPPDPDAVNILLDPGLAFGTGTHPTTALCLEWLDAHPPQDKLVIDYGCGSGILAIAALKLGAKEVWAVDHDPQALEATRDNAARNEVNPGRLKTCTPEELPHLQADTLLANILANPLIELAPRFATLIKPQGQLVLAGILQNQADNIRTAYQDQFILHATKTLEDWVSFYYQRQ